MSILNRAFSGNFGYLETASKFERIFFNSVNTTVTLLTVTAIVNGVVVSSLVELLLATFALGSLSSLVLLSWLQSSFFCGLSLVTAGETGLCGICATSLVASCCATMCWLSRGFLVDVPFRTSHIKHLKASGVLVKVHTLQSQRSSCNAFAMRFRDCIVDLRSPIAEVHHNKRKLQYNRLQNKR